MSLRFRIISANEELSVRFCKYLILALSKIVRVSPDTFFLTKKRLPDCNEYININKLDWKGACRLIPKIRKNGFNFLILSEHFIDWRTANRRINEDLEEFEKLLERYSVNTLIVEEYPVEISRRKTSQFQGVDKWLKWPVKGILTEMSQEYSEGTLVSPFGDIPYFQIDPSVTDTKYKYHMIKVFVGFQAQSFRNIAFQFGDVKFPYTHTWRTQNGESYKTGPIPIAISMSM